MKHKIHNSFLKSILPAVSFGALTGILTSIVINLYKVCAKYAISFSEKGYHYISEHLHLIPIALLAFSFQLFSSPLSTNAFPTFAAVVSRLQSAFCEAS